MAERMIPIMRTSGGEREFDLVPEVEAERLVRSDGWYYAPAGSVDEPTGASAQNAVSRPKTSRKGGRSRRGGNAADASSASEQGDAETPED